MLTSFSVKNYRLFKDFTIGPLDRSNLFTGKNNTGKTTLLEALWLYGGSTNANLSIRVNNFRGIETFQVKTSGIWDNLFHNFDPHAEIVMSAQMDQVQAHELRISIESATEIRIPVSDEQGMSGGEAQRRLLPSITLQTYFPNGEVVTAQGKIENDNIVLERPVPAPLNGIFLAARNRGSSKEIARRFTQIEERLEESVIVQALQVVEPRILDVRQAPAGEGAQFHCKVNIPGFENRRIPLNYLGSGIFRYFEILVAIADNRDGIVLIDEVENGMHYSVLANVWRAIDDLAKEFKVQVFATTHSFECIKSAYEAFKDLPQNPVRLYRLEEKGEQVEAISYSDEALEGAMDFGIEVR